MIWHFDVLLIRVNLIAQETDAAGKKQGEDRKRRCMIALEAAEAHPVICGFAEVTQLYGPTERG